MKKILALILAVFALSACGSDAPTVETPTTAAATPERLANPYEDGDSSDWFAWEMLTDSVADFTDENWHIACGNWEKHRDDIVEGYDFPGGADEHVLDEFFNSHCGLN